jgi:uncharacterized protein YjaZ
VVNELPVTGVTITIFADAAQTIEGYGIGGRAPDARSVHIYIDPQFQNLSQLLPERLPQMLAHELHHTVRHRNPGYGTTLLEAMISEGLADRFSIELLGAEIPPWSEALDDAQAEQYLAAAELEFDNNYDHNKWFFGVGGALPRWTGYTIGFRLVAAYQVAHAGASAAELVHTPANLFR